MHQTDVQNIKVATIALCASKKVVCVYVCKKQRKKNLQVGGVNILTKYQRLTKKGIKYEIFPSTDNSSRRVKDYNEYCILYNRLAELEDKIEKGLLVPRYSILKEWQYEWWCVCEVDEQSRIIAQCKTEEEAKRKLEALQKKG